MARLVLLLMIVLAATTSGCRRRPADVVRLGYFANLSHAQALLAVESGELARALAPTRLETRIFNAGPAVVEALLAGEIDMAYIGPGPAIAAHERTRGAGLRIVSGASADGVVVVAAPNVDATSLAALANVRLATPQLGNTQDISARHHLKALGSDLRHVVPVTNAEQAAMFARGQLDAAWVPEPWGERLVREVGARIVVEERQLWPEGHFPLAVVVAELDFLHAHRDLVARVLAVHRAWTERLQREPDRYVVMLGQALRHASGKSLASGILEHAMTRVTFTDDVYPNALWTMARWTRDRGFAKREPELEGLVDLSVGHAEVAR